MPVDHADVNYTWQHQTVPAAALWDVFCCQWRRRYRNTPTLVNRSTMSCDMCRGFAVSVATWHCTDALNTECVTHSDRIQQIVRRALKRQRRTFTLGNWTCQLIADSGRRTLRSSDTAMFVVWRTNSTFGDRSFAFAGAWIRNSFPSSLRSADLSTERFKQRTGTEDVSVCLRPRRDTDFFA